MFFLEVKLEFDSKEQALRFFKSIKPELEEEYLRSKMRITHDKEKLQVFVSAQDKTALRASLNSLLKPLILFDNIENLDK